MNKFIKKVITGVMTVATIVSMSSITAMAASPSYTNSVGVAGDMSGDKIVNIEPESPTVEIKQKWKDNKTATVEQVLL